MSRTEPRVVVGAAIVREGRVLAARRTAPASAAGRWEFPGGKVDPGETHEQALVREVEEELGVTVEVEGWLEGEEPIGAYVLRVAVTRIVAGEPTPHEHDQLRWLAVDAPGELGAVDWLEGDRPFVARLPGALTSAPDGRSGP